MANHIKILVTGDVVDGHTFYGPFENTNEAIQYADDNLTDETWLVADLHKDEDDAG